VGNIAHAAGAEDYLLEGQRRLTVCFSSTRSNAGAKTTRQEELTVPYGFRLLSGRRKCLCGAYVGDEFNTRRAS
jgi:hypothetical protein